MYTSDNKEDKVLFSKADDAIELSFVRNKPCFLGFLNEREAYIIQNYVRRDDVYTSFYGGCDNALRTLFCASPFETNVESFPIKPVFFKFRECDRLTHRDFLGALTALGINRDCIGDITVGEGCAVCFVKSEIYDFVSSQLFKVGRVGVQIVENKPKKLSLEQKYDEINCTVSSMRLDVIVAAITGLSREKTADFILSGKVFCNYVQVQNVSQRLVSQDILSLRGYGKFIIQKQFGVTKKGRLKLLIKHFR